MILVCVRGLPGSGKTTFAKELTEVADMSNLGDKPREITKAEELNAVEFGADDWPTRYEDEYNPAENVLAHAWCLMEAEKHAREEKPAIFVHNTFVKRDSIKPYATLAKKYNYMFFVITVEGDYTNEHNVPYTVMRKMVEGWEKWETRS